MISTVKFQIDEGILGQFDMKLTSQRDQIDLGTEPPIILKDGQRVPFTNQNASLRWFIGTFLTGFTALVLILGALIFAFDTNISLAIIHDPKEPLLESEFEPSQNTVPIKSDRKLKIDAQYSSRKNIQINTIERVGQRDNVISNPFILVTSTLHTKTDSELTDLIPKFNPLELSQIETGEVTSTIIGNALYDAKIKGNVAISVLDFPIENAFVSSDLTYTSNDIEQIIRNELFEDVTASDFHNNFEVLNPNEQTTSSSVNLPKNNVLIETENISYFQKSDQISRIEGLEEIYDVFEDGDNFNELLLSHGFTEQEIQSIISVIERNFPNQLPVTGQRLRIAFTQDYGISREWRPIRISFYSDLHHIISIALADNGHFEVGKEPITVFPSDAFMVAKRTTLSGHTPTLYNSIYQTALKQNVPAAVIDELIRLYLYDLDFNAKVRVGDSFQILYESIHEHTNEPPEILYSSLTTGGINRTFYRYQIPNSGIVDYFDDKGNSASKFLVRKPILTGNFKSGFGMRKHPVLGVKKMHNGVDWSAPIGTAVIAAGDGVIRRANWISGYGRRVEIQHTDGYRTTYSHLQKFSKEIKRGAKVSQGQVIGYAGSTGLAIGSHLHYEILINNKYVDPMRIQLPRVQELSGNNLNDYKSTVQRLNNILDSHTNDDNFTNQYYSISSAQ